MLRKTISRQQKRRNDMRRILYLLGAAFFLLIAAAKADVYAHSGCVEGEGPVKSENRKLSGYKHIVLDGAFEVLIDFHKRDYTAVVEAQGNLIPLIETKVVSDTLTVKTTKGICTSLPLRITLNPDLLKSLAMNGAEDVEVLDISGQDVNFTINGSGDIKGRGVINRAKINVNGSGNVKMKGIQMKEVFINIKGAGDVEVHAERLLEVDISGTGDVTYAGNPQIKQTIEGVGTLTRLSK